MISTYQNEFFGFGALFSESMNSQNFFNEFAYMSLFFWSSVWIIWYSLLRRNRRFRNGVGATGMIILYGIVILQFLFPVDTDWQWRIRFPLLMNPIRELFIKRVEVFGRYPVTVWQLVLLVWETGSIIQLSRLVKKRIEMHRLISYLPSEQIQLPDHLALLLPDHAKVYRCSGITVPFSTGALKKRILIPDRNYTDTEFENILLHEAAHLRSGDTLIALITDVMCMLHWWNPCVYLLKRDMERCLELRCDRRAVSGMDKEQVACYMETLLKVFKDRHLQNYQAGLGLLGSGKNMREEMRERFDALQSGTKAPKRGAFLRTALSVAIALMLMVLSYNVVCMPYYEFTEDKLDIPADAYYVVGAEAYIVVNEDGSGTLCTPQGDVEIPQEEVESLEADGIKIIRTDG